MSLPSRSIRACIAAFVLLAASYPLMAQRRNSGTTTLSELSKNTVREALGITDEQQEEITKISASSKPDFRKMLAEMRKLKGDEAKKYRDEFNANAAKAREEAGPKALAVLTTEQREKFFGLLIGRQGTSVLNLTSVQDELKITDDQKEKIKAALTDRAKKLREQGGRLERADYDKLKTELDGSVLENLTSDQNKKWTTLAAANQAPVSNRGGQTTRGQGRAVAGTGNVRPTNASPAGGTVSFGKPPMGEDGKPMKLKDFIFNSVGADWRSVLEEFARNSQMTLDLNDTPPGTFTHIDPNTYTPDEALDVMNGYLLRQGYLVVKKDNFLIVWAFDGGLPPTLVPEITPEQLATDYKDIDNQLVSCAFTLESGDVEQIAREIDVLLDPYSFVNIAALTNSKTLIVTDLSSNLRKVKRLIDASTGKFTFQQYKLQFLDVLEANEAVRSHMGLASATPNVSETRSRTRSRTTASSATEGLSISANVPTKSLLVTANAEQHSTIKKLLEVIDVADAAVDMGSRMPYLEVYTMSASNVQEVAKTLEALMPGKIVNEDAGARKLHIKATQAEHEEIRSLIAKLDRGGGAAGETAVLSLKEMEVSTAAQMLANMFATESTPPSIQADAFNQKLVIRGSSEQIEQITAVLLKYGEDGQPAPRSRKAKGPVVRFQMGGRDPEQFMKTFQELWEGPNAIIIKVPSQSSPIRDQKMPGTNLRDSFRPGMETGSTSPATGRRRTTTREENKDYAFTSLFQDGDDQDLLKQFDNQSDRTVPAATPPRPMGDPDKPELLVTYQGDTLILMSNDDDALDRAESLVELVNQSLPAQTTWTVFYLVSADCTEAAAMLEQLFPTSSVSNTSTGDGGMMSSLSSGLSSFGSALTDLTGLNTIGTGPQTLRIIPEVRGNSLYVSGPPYLVSQVEQMLKVIDASELPESARDMRAREAIQLKYASATDVADSVRSLYKTFTESQRGQGQNNNPLASIMGGGGGGGRSQGTPVRLTIDVDESTNRLRVACSDDLYQQIRKLALEMDEDVRRAKPGIKVLTLTDSNAQLIVDTLKNLVPRVSSAADQRNRRNAATAGGGATNTQSAADAARQAAIRNAFGAGGRTGGGATGRTTGRTGGTQFGGGGRGGGGGGRGGGGGGRGGGR